MQQESLLQSPEQPPAFLLTLQLEREAETATNRGSGSMIPTCLCKLKHEWEVGCLPCSPESSSSTLGIMNVAGENAEVCMEVTYTPSDQVTKKDQGEPSDYQPNTSGGLQPCPKQRIICISHTKQYICIRRVGQIFLKIKMSITNCKAIRFMGAWFAWHEHKCSLQHFLQHRIIEL